MVRKVEPYDHHWLRCTDSGIFFQTHLGTRLPIVFGSYDGASSDGAEEELLHLLLDQSSSMKNIQSSAYAGAQELVSGAPTGSSIIFSTFSTRVQLGQRVSKEQALTLLDTESRIADGMTSLYDAIVYATSMPEMMHATVKARVTLVIVTDGMDTSSTRNNQASARDALRRFQAACDSHRVIFVGSNQDAVLTADGMGIHSSQALTFENMHIVQALRSASHNISRLRSGIDSGFTSEERRECSQAVPARVPPQP
jgi:hypothetical protein